MSMPTDSAGLPPFSPDLLYFSFGSNMSRDKVSTRGDRTTPPIEFTAAFPARVKDFRLCFDIRGIIPYEPVMSSMEASPGDDTYGVAYKIKDERSWHKLLRSEGIAGPSSTYYVTTVNAQCFENGCDQPSVQRTVATLMTRANVRVPTWLEDEMYPSERYMKLLLDGAKREQLPEKYIERLTKIPTARVWPRSPLLRIIDVVSPFLFFSKTDKRLGILAAPLRWASGILYKNHERIVRRGREQWSFVDRMSMAGLYFMLYVVYTAYFPMCLVMYAAWSRYRFGYRFIQNVKSRTPTEI